MYLLIQDLNLSSKIRSFNVNWIKYILIPVCKPNIYTCYDYVFKCKWESVCRGGSINFLYDPWSSG